MGTKLGYAAELHGVSVLGRQANQSLYRLALRRASTLQELKRTASASSPAMSDQSASSGTDPYLYELSDSNQLHNFMELSASDSDDDWGATSPAVTRLATASSPSPEVGSEKYEVKLKEYRLLDDLLKENGTAAIFEEHFLARQASKAAKRGNVVTPQRATFEHGRIPHLEERHVTLPWPIV